jgi:hypothetical protein
MHTYIIEDIEGTCLGYIVAMGFIQAIIKAMDVKGVAGNLFSVIEVR